MAETAEVLMGRTTERVKIENFIDLCEVETGARKQSDIRSAEVKAVVDTGAAYLCLPPSVVEQLGLRYSRTRRGTTANGIVDRRVFRGAIVTVRDRSEEMPVMENDAITPALIGYMVLEALDFVVNPKTQQLMPNPEHDGEWITDLL